MIYATEQQSCTVHKQSLSMLSYVGPNFSVEKVRR